VTTPFHHHIDEQVHGALRTGVAVIVDPTGRSPESGAIKREDVERLARLRPYVRDVQRGFAAPTWFLMPSFLSLLTCCSGWPEPAMFDSTCIEADSDDPRVIRFGHGQDCELPANVPEIAVFVGKKVVARVAPADGMAADLTSVRLGEVPEGFTMVGAWPVSGARIEVVVRTPTDHAGILLTMP
jgi:hypothetical protein